MVGVPAAGENVGARARILIVDVHVGSRLALADLLVDSGYDVEIAVDAPGAYRCLKGTPPDLIVLGMIMNGVNGLEVMRRIREHPGFDTTRIIAVSAFDEPKLHAMALESGADAYLLKPLDPVALVLCIEEQLARGREWKMAAAE